MKRNRAEQQGCLEKKYQVACHKIISPQAMAYRVLTICGHAACRVDATDSLRLARRMKPGCLDNAAKIGAKSLTQITFYKISQRKLLQAALGMLPATYNQGNQLATEILMNKPIPISVLCTSLLSLASAGFAQAPTETQMRDNADSQQRMEEGDHNVSRNQKRYFGSLDRNTKGYLTSDDVSADPFMSQNYAKCDGDHDGKLTWREFRACTHNNPPPQQP